MLISGWIYAQSDTTGKNFTLTKAIDYALQNSVNVKNAIVDERIAKSRVGEIRAVGLPQVEGAVQFSFNDPLRRMFLPGGSFILPDVPAGTVIAAPNQFQLRAAGDAGITISQLLLSGSYIVGLKAAKTYRELASKTAQQSKIQTTEAVTKAFYSVLINNERIKLFDSNIARVDSLLRSTMALNESGFAEVIDVNRIKVSLNNLITEKEKFRNLQDLNIELLKFQMNYPMNEDITVIGNIANIELDSMTLDNTTTNPNYGNRIEYSVLETQRELQRLDIKNNYTNYLPTLAAFANFGYFTQSPTLKGLFKTESTLPESSQAGRDRWYPYGLFGINLTVPIFDGFAKHYKLQQSKLNLMKVENGFQSLKSSIDLQVNQSDITLRNSIKTLNSQKENVELAGEVARVTKIKYQEGVGSNLEVTEAEAALREAQINYYNALYDAIIAHIDLQTALGTLVK